MQVSVVIVSYKVPYHLSLCLGSLQLALRGIEAEIIVVDNNSQDETSQLISRYYPEVKYIQNNENVGFSRANNIAIKHAKGEYICLVNPDTVVGSQTIKNAINKHKSIDNCGILGVRLIDGTGNFLPESKINQLNLRIAILKLLGFSKSYYNNAIKETGEGFTATLVGAFMCFKASDYNKTEGLDENYFMYGEDIDLSFQFIKAGLKNYYYGKQTIIHFKGESTLKDKIYFQRFFDSVKLYFKKHYTNSKIMIGIASVFFVLAKYFKKNQMLKVNNRINKFHEAFVVSKSKNLLKPLEDQYKRKVSHLDYTNAKQTDFKETLVIFDPGKEHFDEVIDIMSKNRYCDNIFRINVPQHNVLIGSDSSTSQGEVIKLKADSNH